MADPDIPSTQKLSLFTAGKNREATTDCDRRVGQSLESSADVLLQGHGETRCEGDIYIGPYRLGRELGRGGMGVVALAEHPTLDRACAIKLLPSSVVDNAQARERFLREARIAAKINHPNVVQIYDAGECDRHPYIVMEYVAGGSMAEVVHKARHEVTINQILALVAEAAEGLAAIHEAGILHRDIKPGNILVDDQGHAKIADFGLTKAAGERQDLTERGMAVGTVAYMAPELLHGEEADVRADCYALGVTLFELLAGRRPYQVEGIHPLIDAICSRPTPDLRDIKADIPDLVARVVLQAMAKDPAERFDSAAVMARRLHGLARMTHHAATAARQGEELPGIKRSRRGAAAAASAGPIGMQVAQKRNPLGLVLAGLIAGAVVIGGGWSAWSVWQQSDASSGPANEGSADEVAVPVGTAQADPNAAAHAVSEQPAVVSSPAERNPADALVRHYAERLQADQEAGDRAAGEQTASLLTTALRASDITAAARVVGQQALDGFEAARRAANQRASAIRAIVAEDRFAAWARAQRLLASLDAEGWGGLVAAPVRDRLDRQLPWLAGRGEDRTGAWILCDIGGGEHLRLRPVPDLADLWFMTAECTRAQAAILTDEEIPTTNPQHPALGLDPQSALAIRRGAQDRTGLDWRIPQERAWRSACAAGADTILFSTGNRDFDAFVWYADNARNRPHAVGTTASNHYGFHDMLGNAGELVRGDGGGWRVLGGDYATQSWYLDRAETWSPEHAPRTGVRLAVVLPDLPAAEETVD